MNIYTVRDNLKQTIRGKELLLNSLSPSKAEGYSILKNIIEMNLDELQKILNDVEVCVVQHERMSSHLSAAAWIIDHDRQGGI